MSSDNVELVRRLVAAFNDRDLEGMLGGLAADVELHPLRAQLEGKSYLGHEGARQMLADFEEDWESLRMEVDEIHEAGDEVVLLGRMRGRGRASGVDLEVPMGFVWRFSDGKAIFGRTFSDPADAPRAAGPD